MKLLLDQLTEYAVLFDATGEVRYANRAVCRALGYDNWCSLDATTALVKSDEFKLPSAATNEASANVDLKLRNQRGEIVDFSGALYPIPDSKGAIAIFANPAQKAEQDYEAILAAIPDALFIFDREGRYRRIFTCNPEILVDEPDRMIGKTLNEVLPAEEALPGGELIRKVIDSGNAATADHPLTIRGEQRWFSVRVVPIVDADTQCALWLSRDVTEFAEARRHRLAHLALLEQLLNIQEHERQQLAGELHDGLVQDVVGARMWLESVERNVQGASDGTKQAVEIARKSVDEAIRKSRQLINSLRPVMVEQTGVEASVQALIQQYGRQSSTQFRFDSNWDVGPLFPIMESNIIRICQAALKHIVDHSQADNASVFLGRDGEDVCIVVEDDGVGFDPNIDNDETKGLDTITRRANVFGGTARMETGPNNGTRITVRLPALALGDSAINTTRAMSAIMLDRAQSRAREEPADG